MILEGHKHSVYDSNKCNGVMMLMMIIDNVHATQLIHHILESNGFKADVWNVLNTVITEKGKCICKISLGSVGIKNWRL